MTPTSSVNVVTLANSTIRTLENNPKSIASAKVRKVPLDKKRIRQKLREWPALDVVRDFDGEYIEGTQSVFDNKLHWMPIRRPRAHSADDARGEARRRRPVPIQERDDEPYEQGPVHTGLRRPTAAQSNRLPFGFGARKAGNLTQPEANGAARMRRDVQDYEYTNQSLDSRPILQEDRTSCKARSWYGVYRSELIRIFESFTSGRRRWGQADAEDLVPIDLESLSQQLRVSPSPGVTRRSSAEPYFPESRAVSISTAMGKRSLKQIRFCYTLIALGILTIVGSLAPALWRSANRDDLSGGFSLAQYILGVGVFVIGSMTIIHSKTCTCWQ